MNCPSATRRIVGQMALPRGHRGMKKRVSTVVAGFALRCNEKASAERTRETVQLESRPRCRPLNLEVTSSGFRSVYGGGL